jgi:hypothetical protein
MTLAELFPEEDYRFNFRFERGSISEFFRPTAQHDEIIEQRRFWLKSAPATHAALLPEGGALLEEAVRVGQAERTFPDQDSNALLPGATPWERCLALGEVWEPDFLLLQSQPDGVVRLVAGCVCFPSSWSLAEKMGHPIEHIHGVVPGLNPALGSPIQNFLSRLKPGAAWLRANWGLSRSPELNQHPERKLPRLDELVELEEVWLRIEHQALVALPETWGVLFGIRIAVHPLAEIRRDPVVRRGLLRALKTMPEPMAQYKNIASARSRLISLLQE